MYEYIKGLLIEAAPAYAVVECGGIGYYVNISVNTYSRIASAREVLLYLHQIVREDAHLLYGFSCKEERLIFRQLISVSGVGANTAEVMLSSMSVNEIARAIAAEDAETLKKVKGIGLKTAQRIIIELKDKVGPESAAGETAGETTSTMKEEALSALVMLGFVKTQAAKVLDRLIASGEMKNVEELIKAALRQL